MKRHEAAPTGLRATQTGVADQIGEKVPPSELHEVVEHPVIQTPRTTEVIKAESYLVQLSKAEITRQRANEALKKERRKLENERELKEGQLSKDETKAEQ